MRPACCTVCYREVFVWGQCLMFDLIDNLAGGPYAYFLVTHPCWCDDEEEVCSYPIRRGEMS